MDTSRWERFAPLSGVLFVLFVVAGIIVGASNAPEDFPAAVDDIVQYFEEDPGMVMLSSWLSLLGSFFLIWFGGSVRAVLRDAGQERLGTVAFGGAVATATVSLLMNAAHLAAALRADEDEAIDPAVATTLYDLGNAALGSALPIAFAVFVAATSIAGLRTGGLPRWLAAAGLLLVVALLVPWIAWAATGVALVWALITSVMLFTSHRDRPVVAPVGGPPSG